MDILDRLKVKSDPDSRDACLEIERLRSKALKNGWDKCETEGSVNETYLQESEREAAERVEKELAKRLPEFENDYGEDVFDPWELFPSLCGSYSGDFDRCAIEVLTEIAEGRKIRDDLGAEMFREMLCTAHLCDYGTSPRVCFAAGKFEELLPKLIQMWKAWSLVQWGEDVCT